ncbi:hypothetical protein FZEAL_8708 [Fusarium zealandicum]|uniref:Acetylxylan esterase n=1 Tax=Fusarium zealandicum TaxID=1053134 RepID=A0A8H4XHK3_9HYPO|nr:hypothetical protein FZEAL_8708 [Fusarium zealandicum]
MLPVLILFVFFLAFTGAKSTDGPEHLACAAGAHIIVARGSLEPQGPGIIGQVAQQIVQRIPGSDMESLIYPAEYDNYLPSQTRGVKAMSKMVRAYAKRCPGTKMVLLGYSQGAHVAGDAMCGASSAGYPATKAQAPKVAGKVAAVVLLGDPSRTDGQSFNHGTSKGNGIFPRQKPGGCKYIADRALSICDHGDPFCEAGGDELEVHMNYVATYGEYAVDFVVAQYHSY